MTPYFIYVSYRGVNVTRKALRIRAMGITQSFQQSTIHTPGLVETTSFLKLEKDWDEGGFSSTEG